MRYERIRRGTFINRPNRFIAEIEIDGKAEVCHVKNTGRCKELLIPGAAVYVQEADRAGRKTKYDLIAVEKGGLLINVDSQIPNGAVEEWLRKGNLLENITALKREAVFGDSRFDLYAEYGDGRKAFLEVKGVTLEEDGAARFPDAPTKRGVKHILELCRCVKEGYDAYLIFVIQMKPIRRLEPNWSTHEAFGEALVKAAGSGVHILAYDCAVTPESITVDQEIPVCLERSAPPENG